MYTTRSTFIIFILGILIGVSSVVAYLYFSDFKLTTERSEMVSSVLANLPTCIQPAAVQPESELFLTDILIKDTATVDYLSGARASVQNEYAKSLFTKEIDRRTSEIALYSSVYEETYGKEFVPSEGDLAGVVNSYTYVDVSATDNTYLGILQGSLEYMQRQYYVAALSHPNEKIRKNAEKFMSYKEAITSEIQQAK